MSKYDGTYYIGRVVKIGHFQDDKLIRAIMEPAQATRRGFNWTFIDCEVFNQGTPDEFVFAKLSKYSPNAEVNIVDPKLRTVIRRDEPNLSIAVSPFVYIPKHSGIAFLYVSKIIEKKTFREMFQSLIVSKYDKFFIDCQIDFVADLRSFSKKLSLISKIKKLSARVFPPNPLFGDLWKDLEEYLSSRLTGELDIKETATKDMEIRSSLSFIINKLAEGVNLGKISEIGKTPMGDAAILMAADGYGEGLIEGETSEKKIITIKTSETVKNFKFWRNPSPEDLYRIASSIFEEIKNERYMEHR